MALPAHTLRPLRTAVAAAATVVFISLQVDAVAVATSLVRSTTLGAAATVALVGLEVHAPISAATLAFRAAANLVISTPNAVPRAALGVPTTFPA